mgnify:FL=1
MPVGRLLPGGCWTIQKRYSMEHRESAVILDLCNDSTYVTDTRKEVWAEVVFGSRDRNCRGNGICKVITLRGPDDPGRRQRLCRRAVGRLSCPAPGRLRFTFQAPVLCPHLVRHQFRDGVFKVPAPVLLPGAVRRSLGLKGRWIAKGGYPVQQTEERLEFTVVVRRFQH